MHPGPRKKLREISALDGYFGRHCGRWWTVAEHPKVADGSLRTTDPHRHRRGVLGRTAVFQVSDDAG
jgi:hypothetical protein